jgi:hypothetical protein
VQRVVRCWLERTEMRFRPCSEADRFGAEQLRSGSNSRKCGSQMSARIPSSPAADEIAARCSSQIPLANVKSPALHLIPNDRNSISNNQSDHAVGTSSEFDTHEAGHWRSSPTSAWPSRARMQYFATMPSRRDEGAEGAPSGGPRPGARRPLGPARQR